MTDPSDRTHPMDRLAATIEARRGADLASSWTAQLLAKGTSRSALVILSGRQNLNF